MQRIHGELEAVGAPLLDGEHDGRDDHRDDRQRGGEVAVRAAFAQVRVVDHDREGLVALADEHRRAEVRKRLHEHHQRRGENRGHGQGQHDLHQTPHTRAAHVGGGLHQRVVDVLERAVHVDEHQREELERLHQQDALEAIDGRHLHAQQRGQELRDRAAAAQQQNPGIRSDERRGHAAQDGDDEQKFRAPDFIERVEVRNRHAQQQRHQRGDDGHLDAVGQGLEVIAVGIGEESPEVVQRELPVRVEHGLLEQAHHREEQEHHEQREQQQRYDDPLVSLLCLHRRPPPLTRRRSRSARR